MVSKNIPAVRSSTDYFTDELNENQSRLAIEGTPEFLPRVLSFIALHRYLPDFYCC
ncbi:MAG: hypothetical protein ACOXZO_00765 [Bacteroidales bacterium]